MDDTLRDTLARDAADLYAFGWLLGTSGNLSARLDADHFVITASGRHKGRLGRDDFVVCDLNGTPRPGDPRPSAETSLHCAIYSRLPGVGAVYHVHDPHAALCSDRDAALGHTPLDDVEMIKALGIWDDGARVQVPIIPNPAHIPTLTEHLVEHLDAGNLIVPAVNVLRHGTYAWGKDPFGAMRHTEALGYLFRYAWELGAGSSRGEKL